jgi:hypothetical protein
MSNPTLVNAEAIINYFNKLREETAKWETGRLKSHRKSLVNKCHSFVVGRFRVHMTSRATFILYDFLWVLLSFLTQMPG